MLATRFIGRRRPPLSRFKIRLHTCSPDFSRTFQGSSMRSMRPSAATHADSCEEIYIQVMLPPARASIVSGRPQRTAADIVLCSQGHVTPYFRVHHKGVGVSGTF
ncbi:uncharacterized protein PV07_11255 [Cladophialophora immunda]|uniref:Uncharacterized protein n=1 Tax=Cladophialophora immunda TaxID=569365 RepID=A0A0D2ADS4_9EURO|nr:uncharacterized protein PV07_11255 [Cladophialophora immunda]KIW23022.1 hypothetical protein PV07_11255 [Cladophialophora immunda]